ncbi:MAG: hypothetical protein FWH14_05760 [Oscillospiraceae bacterium]|nr:hypothetical protein [Oscillospiraceae bacterium]
MSRYIERKKNMNTMYIRELEDCKTINALDTYLEECGMVEASAQFEFLKDYMCLLFAGKFGNPLPEEECNALKRAFIEGSWRKKTNKYELIDINNNTNAE